jgi:glycosyltransferase involved in cell wall biosynthesis
VVFFRPTLGDGGADRVTLTLLEQLDRARFRPTLALMRREGQLVDRVPKDVEVLELGARRLAFAAPSLARLLRDQNPDIVMCTAGGANVVAVAAHRLARSRARLVLSERNAVRRPGLELRNRFDVPLKRYAYRLADVVTAVSDGVAADLREVLGLPDAHVKVTYNPVVGDDIATLATQPVEHPWLADKRPVIVAVGRLVAQKDYPTMLRAFVELRARADARLIILGIGPDRAALEAITDQLGIAADVAFVGFDPNPYRWMARARLLIQSSRAEGLPGTLIQSMACGTPVVATDCDHGPREVIRDGIDGFLVPVGDASALAERASRLLADRHLRDRMAIAARASAQRYSIVSSMKRYESALEGAHERA